MESTTCCIAGGGPAGMVLGLLLARAGVEVTVLEKHADFLRDFRGDTVHPTTLELLDDLGLGERFAAIPHSRLTEVVVPVAGSLQRIGNLRHLPGRYQYIAMVPQWDLLNLLAEAGAEEPTFTLRLNTEATDLLREGGRVTGVRYRTRDGDEGSIAASLTIACDGRHSALRAAAGLPKSEWPVPFDVWWFRIPRKPDEPAALVPVIGERHPFLLINRGEYWQVAAIIPKGADSRLRREPVSRLLTPVAAVVPWLADRVDSVRSWDEVKLLDVRLDRLRRWHLDGLLCLGDAAHAMSPVGGVGINLAVQDAVAAARLLAASLRRGMVRPADLARVRRRRLPATVLVQTMQRFLHEKALGPALAGRFDVAGAGRLPLPMRLVRGFPWLQRIPAYLVARGFRPERAPAFARRAGPASGS
ncbi:FAD-dependent oxidoreductase [Stackebrandtia nassauensis]|uniref:Monooxygenase FAD-binding protein n=1 Tax=Stackebrandtia nassauensis (strain DSM 44728 / CIP 108903 / NRRL B-16338 / NBRC 102104 / LLR-40K-21) TaxID=446470 RepID=D3Q6D5_STANL|nr:FAD-dependent oxidoreductase [Stackebrandtia nassauensis]ADD42310.1 monooxygenase FAD-binding protein [Stackebrandtia nassauensis DSM 44728]